MYPRRYSFGMAARRLTARSRGRPSSTDPLACCAVFLESLEKKSKMDGFMIRIKLNQGQFLLE